MTESPTDHAAGDPCRTGSSVRIVTGARLHFGLLDTADPFGGIGAMIRDPATEVRVSHSDQFVCPQAVERLQPIAARVASLAGIDGLPAVRIDVVRQAHPHCGLGSGTQLAMATAEALCELLGVAPQRTQLACELAQRGRRSAIGVHGYFQGGLLYEHADQPSPLNPLRSRVTLSEQWCVVICQSTAADAPIAGELERQQFASLSAADRDTVAELQRLIEDQILPAAKQQRFADFASAVRRYNTASGMLFADVQGGPFNGAAVSDLVDWWRRQGVDGVGQSSWGPGVFAWFESAQQAQQAVARLPAGIELIAMTGVLNEQRSMGIESRSDGMR